MGPEAEQGRLTDAPPPPAGAAADVDLLRRVLRDAGYTGPAVQARLGTGGDVLSRPPDFPAHLRRLDGDETGLASLIRLFVLLASEDAAVADTSLAPLGSAGLERLGLVRREGNRLVATARLVPHDDLVIASDLLETGADGRHVPGVQRPSNTLASLTVRRPVARALDLGTGNGVQALLAARHAEHVVATDVNPRALAFARFNVALAGVADIELREGSLFEPVADERFDLVVANPPYVISPESRLVFRDSGFGRDRVSEEVVRAAPHHLAKGGLATIMVSWIEDGDESTARPQEWLEGSGCDAWILHTGSDDPLSAAAGWNRSVSSLEERAQRIDEWLAYFRSEGIESIGYGAILLRRRSGDANWIRTTELPRARLGPAGMTLERMLAAPDLLAEGDAALLARRLAPARETRLEQLLAPAAGGWRLESAELRQTVGLGFVAGLDESATRLVAGLDGSTPLGEALAAAAADLGADPTDFARAGTVLVRRMVELGFLVPADAENDEGRP